MYCKKQPIKLKGFNPNKKPQIQSSSQSQLQSSPLSQKSTQISNTNTSISNTQSRVTTISNNSQLKSQLKSQSKPQFINQINRQWPSWSFVKQKVGIIDQTSGDNQFRKNFIFQKSQAIPDIQYAGRGWCRNYYWFVDTDNGVTYFYPFYSLGKSGYPKLQAHPTEQTSSELNLMFQYPVKVVLIPVAARQLKQYFDEINRLINNRS